MQALTDITSERSEVSRAKDKLFLLQLHSGWLGAGWLLAVELLAAELFDMDSLN